MKFTVFAMSLAALAAGASAQQVGTRGALNGLLTSSTTDDFERYNVVAGGADNLATPTLDSTTIANGQGPALVNPGARYSDPSNATLQWNGDTYFGMSTRTILANGSTGTLRINYAGTVHAMGLDARAFNGFGYSGVMDVYNGATVVGSLGFSLATGGPESVFLGWQNAGGITHVEVFSSNFSWSPIIDNHTYGTVPEPFTMTVLAGAGLAFFARRRKTA